MKFGSTIRPELGRMDFSGIERGGRAYAEGVMRGSELLGAGIRSAGASIGQAIEKTGEMKSNIKAAQSVMQGITGMEGIDPRAIERLNMMSEQLTNEEIPLSQRNAMASTLRSMGGTLFSAGIQNYMQSQQAPKVTFGDIVPLQGGGMGQVVRTSDGNVRVEPLEGVAGEQPIPVSEISNLAQRSIIDGRFNVSEFYRLGSESNLLNEKTAAYFDELADNLRPTGPGVSVNLPSEEPASEKIMQGIYGREIESSREQAENARNQQQTLGQMLSLIGSTTTGFGANQILAAKKLIEQLGGNPEGIAEGETLNALSNQLALRLRNPESGMGLTGNTSDRDVQFLKASVPGLQQTEAGNRRLIEIAMALNERQIMKSEMQTEYFEKNGNLRGFNKVWNEYLNDPRNSLEVKFSELPKFDSEEAALNAVRDNPLLSGKTVYINGRKARLP